MKATDMSDQHVRDHIELEQLVAAYALAIDAKDWARLDKVFTSDAQLDYSSSGGDDAKGDWPTIRAWLQQNLAMFPMTQHVVGKSVIALDGDSAHCITQFHNPMGVPIDDEGFFDEKGSGLHVFVVGGTYHDDCVRTDDGWRISAKCEQQLFMTGGFPSFR